MIILFTPPNAVKILLGLKTMTARFWKQNPPRIGDIVDAQTGRRKDTRFAKLKITGLTAWDLRHDTPETLEKATGYTSQQIAEKEGFEDWEAFEKGYTELNAHLSPDDPDRCHYFIEFELLSSNLTLLSQVRGYQNVFSF